MRRFTTSIACGVLLAFLSNGLVLTEIQAEVFWDNNGSSAGFGTASGTWAAPTTGNASQGWSTDSTGTLLPADVTTTTADTVNFGTDALGLGSGTITLSGIVSAGQVRFGKASGPITLSGGTISLANGGTSSFQAASSGAQARPPIRLTATSRKRADRSVSEPKTRPANTMSSMES